MILIRYVILSILTDLIITWFLL